MHSMHKCRAIYVLHCSNAMYVLYCSSAKLLRIVYAMQKYHAAHIGAEKGGRVGFGGREMFTGAWVV